MLGNNFPLGAKVLQCSQTNRIQFIMPVPFRVQEAPLQCVQPAQTHLYICLVVMWVEEEKPPGKCGTSGKWILMESCGLSTQSLTVFQRSLTTMQIQVVGLLQFAVPLFPTAEVRELPFSAAVSGGREP